MRRSPATHELHDLQGGSLADFGFVPFLAPNYGPVQFHSHSRRVHSQTSEQLDQVLARSGSSNLSIYNNLYLFCSNVHRERPKTGN
jgi:hypothetical protein